MIESSKFDQWAIVEIMGHQKYAGRVTEQAIAGSGMLRVDIPKTPKQPAFTKLFNVASLYSLTPVTEELATGIAAELNVAPMTIYDLPEAMRDKLRAPSQARLPQFTDDDVTELGQAFNDDDERYDER